MNFKKFLIIGLLILSIWAVNSNDDPRNNDEINPENDNVLSSSDESDDGKFWSWRSLSKYSTFSAS